MTVFTPRTSPRRNATRVHINAVESDPIEDRDGVYKITSADTGIVFTLKRAACGLGCKCDAIILAVGCHAIN